MGRLGRRRHPAAGRGARPDGARGARRAARRPGRAVVLDEVIGRSATTVVRVSVGDAPWLATAPPDRVLRFDAPSLPPEAFTPPASPATGEWFVVIADRVGAQLASGDPDGIVGQAARLERVLRALAPVDAAMAVVATAEAGHAAARAADAVAEVTDLVTLGTPWTAVTLSVIDVAPAARGAPPPLRSGRGHLPGRGRGRAGAGTRPAGDPDDLVRQRRPGARAASARRPAADHPRRPRRPRRVRRAVAVVRAAGADRARAHRRAGSPRPRRGDASGPDRGPPRRAGAARRAVVDRGLRRRAGRSSSWRVWSATTPMSSP